MGGVREGILPFTAWAASFLKAVIDLGRTNHVISNQTANSGRAPERLRISADGMSVRSVPICREELMSYLSVGSVIK